MRRSDMRLGNIIKSDTIGETMEKAFFYHRMCGDAPWYKRNLKEFAHCFAVSLCAPLGHGSRIM